MNHNSEFFNKSFLEEHILDTLTFYEPSVYDKSGGFFQYFLDDGTIYDHSRRHLVSSTRFVFNYATAANYFSNSKYKELAHHGLNFLEEFHFQKKTGGYAWLLDKDITLDASNHCYGLAFVMIAGSTAILAGIDEGHKTLEKAYKLMERHFWNAKHELYSDEANEDFSKLSSYRGQNANMHACEAMLWAFEATKNKSYLERAIKLAENITQRQAAKTDGLIWEHFNNDWEVDWDYNKNDPKNLFRPWGFQPGHQIEWAKLLLILNRYQPENWHLQKAKVLFDIALNIAWDDKNGGIFYGFSPEREICDSDKYFWVQAEGFAAAALLAEATHEKIYYDWYEKIWKYSWKHMVDHQYGAWFRMLTHNNKKYDDKKSPAGKTDYHTMGACYEVLRTNIVSK
ncbi:MAG: N-acylglucosamine 2-epimerase [Gammaproteobacteria bacterium]|nr:N-acylglucosamine 2-epimerase [Gammaproteobacteria bacterium]